MVAWRGLQFPSAKSKYKSEQNCQKQPFRGSGRWPRAVKKLIWHSCWDLGWDLRESGAFWPGCPQLPLQACSTTLSPLLPSRVGENGSFTSLGLENWKNGTEKTSNFAAKWWRWRSNLIRGREEWEGTKTCGFARCKVVDLVGNKWRKPAALLAQGCGPGLGWAVDHKKFNRENPRNERTIDGLRCALHTALVDGETTYVKGRPKRACCHVKCIPCSIRKSTGRGWTS